MNQLTITLNDETLTELKVRAGTDKTIEEIAINLIGIGILFSPTRSTESMNWMEDSYKGIFDTESYKDNG